MALNRDALRVVLLSPRNPLNIGAAARAMSNFGFTHLRVVNAYDVAYQEARSAVNASAILAGSVQYASAAEAVKDCTLVVGTASPGHRAPHLPLKRLELGARLIQEASESGPVALLFGSEKFGMNNEEISHCHWLMHIPTRAEHDSMNLGQAVAVCLYELIRDGGESVREPVARRAARFEDLQRLDDYVHKVAEQTGYLNPTTAESTEQKLREMIMRLNLSERDVQIWFGIFRQVLWKLGQDTE